MTDRTDQPYGDRHINCPGPPWYRNYDVTFCGADVSLIRVSVDPEVFLARVDELPGGRDLLDERRGIITGIGFCKLCMINFGVDPEFLDNPVAATVRWLERTSPNRHSPRRTIATAHLLAIADLVAAHRAEFDQLEQRWEAMFALEAGGQDSP